jgi:hypothetical protein
MPPRALRPSDGVVKDSAVSGLAGRSEEVDHRFIDVFGLVVMEPVGRIR